MTAPRAVLALTVGATALLAASAHVPRVLVLNLTSSLTPGLYLTSLAPIMRGDAVLVRPSGRTHRLAVARGYLPANRSLLKRVAALGGDQVCRGGLALWINGDMRLLPRRTDRLGRELPRWLGCRVLADGEILVLGQSADSWDGRYFGAVAVADRVVRALPILLFRHPSE